MKQRRRAFALVGTIAIASSLVACSNGPTEVNADDTGEQSNDNAVEESTNWLLSDVTDDNVVQFCNDVVGPIDDVAQQMGIDPSVLDEDDWKGVARGYGDGERITCMGLIDGSWRNFNVTFASYDAKDGLAESMVELDWVQNGDVEAVVEAEYVEGGIPAETTEPFLTDALEKVEAGEKRVAD